MLAREAERLGQLGAPGGDGLLGPRIDQVERDAVEMGVRRRDGRAGLVRAVAAAEEA